MTEEARQRIDELRKERRGILVRNYLLIGTSTATLLMALVLFTTLARQDEALVVYVQEAQKTVKVACEAAEGEPLPADVQRSCNAAKRNEFPKVLDSVVDNPDPNDPEIQDSEKQESETQDPEVQDPESPDGEVDDPDPDDPETQDEETQEEEVQESEIQEPEIQEPEEQNSPVCPTGYSQKTFHYFGPDGQDGTGDEQEWLLCVRN